MYKCEGCQREISKEFFDSIKESNGGVQPPCKECGGTFWLVERKMETKKDSKDAILFVCEHCRKKITEEKNQHPRGVCYECGDEPLCDDCLIPLRKVSVCKRCIDKAYPKKVEIIASTKSGNDDVKDINKESASEEQYSDKSKFD